VMVTHVYLKHWC